MILADNQQIVRAWDAFEDNDCRMKDSQGEVVYIPIIRGIIIIETVQMLQKNFSEEYTPTEGDLNQDL